MFDYDAYSHIPKDKRSKLDQKGLKCKLNGYSETQKGFRLYDPLSGKRKISRDVIFNENLNNTPTYSQPCNDTSDVGVLIDIREVGDA
jgi:hypothetical protein